MSRKISRSIIAIAIAHLVFILSISPTWGVTTYSDSLVLKSNDAFNKRKPRLVLVPRKIAVRVDPNAVDTYLEDHNLNEVELKVEMTEELVTDSDGEDEVYLLNFTFSPAGCYFDTALKLKIKGEYKRTGYSASLCEITGGGIAYDQSGRNVNIYDFGEASDGYYSSWYWAASYFSSVVVERGKGGNIHLNQEAKIKIKSGSVDDYLDQEGLDSVEITAEMYYGWDGSIWFVFGPSGTFFSPDELELTISGGYLEEDMLLVGEDGELLEYTLDEENMKLCFYIPHFSSYYYDDYDY